MVTARADVYRIATAQNLYAGRPAPPPLPAAGAALLIAAAGGHNAVNPGQLTLNQWEYSVFGSYGSGTFNPYWSADGAYMLAGTGGHNHPEIFGCVYFDWATRAWGYIPAVGQLDRGPVSGEQTNGEPWLEMTGTTIPAPPHPYARLSVIPPSLGGGPQGSMIYITRGAVTVAARPAPVAHRLSLPGGVWTRASEGVATISGLVVFDAQTSRYYTVPGQPWSFNVIQYLDALDWTWKTRSIGTPLSGGTTKESNAFLHGRLLVIHQSDAVGTGRFQAVNIDTPAGWTTLNATGPGVTDNHLANAWTYHAAQGVYYRRAADIFSSSVYPQGQTLYKLTPPENPLTGEWVTTAVTLTGDTVPEHRGTNVGTQAFRRLMYLPTLQMLGWVTVNGVALLNPV